MASVFTFRNSNRKACPVCSNGRPHLAPVWFDLDRNDLIFMTGKSKNILRDPRVMISIDDERPPFAFALVEGTAQGSELSPADLLP
jgi:hypothetical protein